MMPPLGPQLRISGAPPRLRSQRAALKITGGSGAVIEAVAQVAFVAYYVRELVADVDTDTPIKRGSPEWGDSHSPGLHRFRRHGRLVSTQWNWNQSTCACAADACGGAIQGGS